MIYIHSALVTNATCLIYVSLKSVHQSQRRRLLRGSSISGHDGHLGHVICKCLLYRSLHLRFTSFFCKWIVSSKMYDQRDDFDFDITKAVLTSTHNLCFGAKLRKIGIPLHTPVLLCKSGVQGGIHNTDMFS